MRATFGLGALVLAVATIAPAVAAGELPVDEDAIVSEMEALVDSTPAPDEKAREAVRNLTRKGIKAHDAQEYGKAVKLYRQALDLDPLADDVYYELAYSFSRQGKPEAALDAAIRALTLNPKAEMYHVLKANILDDLGFRDAARDAYLELIAIQPASLMGHLNLGITFVRLNEPEEAEAAFLRAIEIAPDHPSAYLHMGMLSKSRGYDYDARSYLEKFLEVGRDDPRRETAEAWLEELNRQDLVLTPDHPYPEIEMIEQTARMVWRATKHRTEFPDARGYEPTFEEDQEVYRAILDAWRATKAEDPDAAYGKYDLLLRIDDAGYLEEYIWYHRQNAFGDRAGEWLAQHSDRVDAFLGWARAEGLLEEEPRDAVEASQLDLYRGLPAELLDLLEESDTVYEVALDPDRPDGLLEAERERYSRGFKLDGEDRVSCGGKAAKILDGGVLTAGARALVPVLRCFVPGEPVYEKGMLRAASLGLEFREIEFRPVADLVEGDDVRVSTGEGWLFYGLAKAAWRNEPSLRERYGVDPDGDEADLVGEAYALAVLAGSYANSLEPDDPDDSDEPDEASAPPERLPALDRLLEAIEADQLRGYLLYEVLHKAYGVPLERLEPDDARVVSEYLFAHVIFRTGTAGG